MRSREFIKEASGKLMTIQRIWNTAEKAFVYILKGPNGEVQDPTGQILTYRTQRDAANARDKMSDPVAVRSSDLALDQADGVMRAGEAGKVGSGSGPGIFQIPVVDPSTGGITQKITYKDANGKDQTIVKSYKDWSDYRDQTGINPAGSWRPGYTALLIDKLSGTTWLTLKFFSAGDIALIANILSEWVKVVDTIKAEYSKNIYSNKESGTAGVQAMIDQENKKYIAKLAKAIAVILTTNFATNSIDATRAVGSKFKPAAGGVTLANAIIALFKSVRKPINPTLAKLAADGGVESTKLLTAYIVSNNELSTSPETHWLVAPLIKWVIWVADLTIDGINFVLKALPLGKDLQITPADIEAMNKSATANNQKPTKPPTPPSNKPGDEPSLSTDIRNAVNAAPD